MTPVVRDVYDRLIEINGQVPYPVLSAISPVPGQSLKISFKGISFLIQLDSGATVSFIRWATAKKLGCNIGPNGQLALLADQKTRMQSLGEINILVTTENFVLRLRALVVNDLQVEAYAGTTFHVDNGVKADISSGLISLHRGLATVKQYNPMVGGRPIPHPPPFLNTGIYSKQINSDTIYQDLNQHASPAVIPYPPPYTTMNGKVDFGAIDNLPMIQKLSLQVEQIATELKNINTCHTEPVVPRVSVTSRQDTEQKSSTIHVMNRKTILPDDSCDIQLNAANAYNTKVALIPQFSRSTDQGPEWQAQVCDVDDQGSATYRNKSQKFLTHPKGVHFNVVPVSQVSRNQALWIPKEAQRLPGGVLPISSSAQDSLKEIKINKAILSANQLETLTEAHIRNISVFNDDLNTGYEGYESRLNFKVEQQAPPFRLWVPQYNKKAQDLLQSKCDQLEMQGVLEDPIKNNITVRNVSPCFVQ